ncbi:MAG: helix-turn-helix domain-containing protein [Acidobacteriia bacterium]|nr:helix-turn-helix domain-containing protein [Terriglobia bacterium]
MEQSARIPSSARRKQQRSASAPTYASVDDLAREIGVSRHACYEGIKNGIIPHIRIGRRIVLPKTAIADWLKTAGRRETPGANDGKYKPQDHSV